MAPLPKVSVLTKIPIAKLNVIIMKSKQFVRQLSILIPSLIYLTNCSTSGSQVESETSPTASPTVLNTSNAPEKQSLQVNSLPNADLCNQNVNLAEEPGLERDLGVEGFFSYSWLRPEDKKPLYQSTLFITTTGNRLCAYRAIEKDPFGSLARCGGLGCGSQHGELLATLDFKPNRDNTFLVQSANGLAGFMSGAVCQIEKAGLPEIVCRSSKSPAFEGESIIVFSAGS